MSSRDRVLPHEDEDAALVLEDALAERGVELVKHARADKVVRDGDTVTAHLADGSTVTGSHVLMTVGSIPNTANLELERAGVDVDKGGYIRVDRVSRTSVPGIYAAGDCTGLLPLASVAAMQGRIAVYHALGEGVSPIKLKTVASAIFTRPEIATVGVSQKAIDAGEYPARTVMLPLATNPRAKMSGLRRGFVKIFCRPATGVVIGGVAVAPPNASELILPLALAVQNKLTVGDLAQTFSVYPSLSGSITEPHVSSFATTIWTDRRRVAATTVGSGGFVRNSGVPRRGGGSCRDTALCRPVCPDQPGGCLERAVVRRGGTHRLGRHEHRRDHRHPPHHGTRSGGR